eukprot:CAMPEP_0171322274 /NCGR_PEP_ID=MMETSP0816-20121228/114857_1 /TAXON_ID=420281 /ORGANISM="Proboscia inermis, Strain CCAP1064/1" /LENGTH=154 /DNA_ID=CAMNT_0011820711 /DNA_START=164 /DNA_END=628 /DNA_ORIENTATION=+
MGMKFMQRKLEQKEATDSIRRNLDEEDSSKKREMESDETMEDVDQASGSSAEICQQPEMASSSDMYGITAQIVGRRSFGGFNKSVEETWKSDLESRESGRISSRAMKLEVSDEELLRRYEKYVHRSAGQTSSSSGSKRNTNNVSSLDSGQKRKR